MDTHKILRLVDEFICAKTGKHLNDLQRVIIEGTLKRQKYAEIAKTYGCTTNHAKDVGYELLQILSDVFSETVDKNHLKSVIEHQCNINIAYINNNPIIGSIKFVSQQPNATLDNSQPVTPKFYCIKNKT